MEATERNEKTAREIINALAENKCTVADAEEILAFVRRYILQITTVPMVNTKLFDR